ncbi:MAG: ABC transporter substrate-binding protein [Thermotaleaceae bacterium]
MKTNWKAIILCLLLVIFLVGCVEQDIHKARTAWIENQERDLLIAVAGRQNFLKEDTDFMKGVYMALDTVNSNNGINGRLLKILEKDDAASVVQGTIIAQDLAKNPAVVAVIGHTSTHITLPVSTIYENAGMLLMSPIVSNVQITQRGHKYLFQNIVSDDEIGKEMALYAKSKDYKNIMIYYADNPYGRGLANAFEDVAKENGIKTIDRVSQFSSENEFQRALQKWKALDMDAIFIADSIRTGKKFIMMLKENDVNVPILGGDGLDANFIEELGPAAEGAVIATLFNPEENKPRLKKFIRDFKELYGHEPDVWAIQGYETIELLTDAMGNAKTLLPQDIAKELKSIASWEGIADDICFDENGKVIGKSIYKKKVQDGKFYYIQELQ